MGVAAVLTDGSTLSGESPASAWIVQGKYDQSSGTFKDVSVSVTTAKLGYLAVSTSSNKLTFNDKSDEKISKMKVDGQMYYAVFTAESEISTIYPEKSS